MISMKICRSYCNNKQSERDANLFMPYNMHNWYLHIDKFIIKYIMAACDASYRNCQQTRSDVENCRITLLTTAQSLLNTL